MSGQPSHTDLHVTTAVQWSNPSANPIADLQAILMAAHMRYGYEPIALRIHPTDLDSVIVLQIVKHLFSAGPFSLDELNLWLARNLGVVIHSQPGTEGGKVFVLDRYGQVLALLVVG